VAAEGPLLAITAAPKGASNLAIVLQAQAIQPNSFLSYLKAFILFLLSFGLMQLGGLPLGSQTGPEDLLGLIAVHILLRKLLLMPPNLSVSLRQACVNSRNALG
jgi:hypothetical protein